MARRSLHIAVVTPRYTLSGVALAQHRLAAALADAGHPRGPDHRTLRP